MYQNEIMILMRTPVRGLPIAGVVAYPYSIIILMMMMMMIMMMIMRTPGLILPKAGVVDVDVQVVRASGQDAVVGRVLQLVHCALAILI